MKLSGALVLLGAALLLTSGGNCGICPALKDKISHFIDSSVSDYLAYVKQYKDDPATLEHAENVKKCADNTLTEEHKESLKSLLEKIDKNAFC